MGIIYESGGNLLTPAPLFGKMQSWLRHLARRMVAKVEHHSGELFPRVGFIVTNLSERHYL